MYQNYSTEFERGNTYETYFFIWFTIQVLSRAHTIRYCVFAVATHKQLNETVNVQYCVCCMGIGKMCVRHKQWATEYGSIRFLFIFVPYDMWWTPEIHVFTCFFFFLFCVLKCRDSPSAFNAVVEHFLFRVKLFSFFFKFYFLFQQFHSGLVDTHTFVLSISEYQNIFRIIVDWISFHVSVHVEKEPIRILLLFIIRIMFLCWNFLC